MPTTEAEQVWQVQIFGSGTHVVTTGDPDKPWLYVYGPTSTAADGKTGQDARAVHERYFTCEDLNNYLNGGPRPAWLDDMRRASEVELVGVDGSSITAVGPMYDRNPPHLQWWPREDAAACDSRARLIDRLCGIGT